jgi:hypothetical protein
MKMKVCQLAALTDRGKLQDPLVSEEGLYAGMRVGEGGREGRRKGGTENGGNRGKWVFFFCVCVFL